MANVLGVKTNVGIRLIIALITGLEFGLNILEKSWIFFVYALFLAIDFVKNKIKNIYKICNKASAENS